MEAILLGLVVKYPVAMSAFAVIGVLRAIFKPIMTAAHAYVGATDSKSDDEALDKVEKSALYKAFAWFIDYTASIKLPK